MANVDQKQAEEGTACLLGREFALPVTSEAGQGSLRCTDCMAWLQVELRSGKRGAQAGLEKMPLVS